MLFGAATAASAGVAPPTTGEAVPDGEDRGPRVRWFGSASGGDASLEAEASRRATDRVIGVRPIDPRPIDARPNDARPNSA